MNVQIITREDQPEWAIIPYETYLQLIDKAELLQDIQDFDTVKSAIDNGGEELIPSHVVYAILDGENPLKVWREYRQLTQESLAKMVGISVPYLSQLETAKRKGSIEVLSAIARALKVSLDDIVIARS